MVLSTSRYHRLEMQRMTKEEKHSPVLVTVPTARILLPNAPFHRADYLTIGQSREAMPGSPQMVPPSFSRSG